MPMWAAQKVRDTESSQMFDQTNAFLKAFSKSRTHNCSFWRSSLWAHWLYQPDKCDPLRVLFLFSFLLLSQWYQRCWTHCFIFSFLKEDTAVYQNIPSPQLLQIHFLNNTLVIWILSYFSCGDFWANNTIAQMAAQCSRLMYFIRGSVLHVWLNLMGQKALGQFFWHFKNAKAGMEGSCAATDRKRGGFWERLGLLCLLMMV